MVKSRQPGRIARVLVWILLFTTIGLGGALAWTWTFVTKLNTRHMELAWTTLGTLMLTDGYIALVSSGTFSDLRIIN